MKVGDAPYVALTLGFSTGTHNEQTARQALVVPCSGSRNYVSLCFGIGRPAITHVKSSICYLPRHYLYSGHNY